MLVATTNTAGQLGPIGSEGLARMVVPGDHARGRYVSDQLTVSGQVSEPATFTPISLAALNQSTTETATFLSGGAAVTDTYTGVPLWTLLHDQGLVTDPTIKNDVLRFGVVATGSDGYAP